LSELKQQSVLLEPVTTYKIHLAAEARHTRAQNAHATCVQFLRINW
jgi:hypothetical protein